MAIRLITFATDDFSISASRLEATAKRFGVEETHCYTPRDFSHHFFRMIKHMIGSSRGHGWWAWKPYIISRDITLSNTGDYLIYCDAGTELVDNVQHIIKAMDEDIFFCSNGWQHSHWCKKEVATAIDPFLENNGSKSYYEHKQVQASFIVFKVTEKVKQFVQEWYAWSIMPGFIDNTPRGPQFPEFQEHRHDQAILTCLQIKYGYKLHWFPSTMNHHQDKTGAMYPQILNHHRKRDNQW